VRGSSELPAWGEADGPQVARGFYGGPRSGVGAWYDWDGNRKAGRGRPSLDKLIGPDLEQGLANLKAASEAGSRGTPDRD
jgi:hypothetical protein